MTHGSRYLGLSPLIPPRLLPPSVDCLNCLIYQVGGNVVLEPTYPGPVSTQKPQEGYLPNKKREKENTPPPGPQQHGFRAKQKQKQILFFFTNTLHAYLT